jgi:sirohydrochlorin cobaltochelatase
MKMKTKNISLVLSIVFVLASFNFYEISAQNKVGVLVLAHGGNENWNKTVGETVEPLRKDYVVEVAFGMADPKTMQTGIDNLENKGVDKIIVVPLFISSFSPIIRQNEYLLGYRKELADEPMIMDHSSDGHSQMDHSQMNNMSSDMQQNNSEDHSGNYIKHITNHNMEEMHHSSKKVELKPLDIKEKIYFTEALDDHPLVSEIIADRIKELSKSPKDETVILVAHGPNDEDDNKNWVKTMESTTDKLRKEFSGENKFRNIFCTTVRDDAPKEIYEMAKENLRSLVRQAAKDGDVIIVPLLLSQGGIEKGIVKRLEGLDYVWNGKTLLPDKKITEFLMISIENVLK